jgi:UPF0716 protein FxsA
MLIYLFLLFTIVPIVELAILVWIGGETQWWVPILLVIGTGVLGAVLARWQGWQVLQRIRADAAAGRVPADALLDGFLILLAGILLVTPGVLSDLFGVALLIPPVRGLVKRGATAWIKRNIEFRVGKQAATFWTHAGDGDPASQRDEIIDARVVRTTVEDAESDSRRGSRPACREPLASGQRRFTQCYWASCSRSNKTKWNTSAATTAPATGASQ